jgi:hypothetical protein
MHVIFYTRYISLGSISSHLKSKIFPLLKLMKCLHRKWRLQFNPGAMTRAVKATTHLRHVQTSKA